MTNWGVARVAVISLRDEITRNLAAGFSVAEIYRQHSNKLGHMTLSAFRRQVRLIVKGPPLPSSGVDKEPRDGHKSSTGTFAHSLHIRQDDRQQLLGGVDDRRK